MIQILREKTGTIYGHNTPLRTVCRALASAPQLALPQPSSALFALRRLRRGRTKPPRPTLQPPPPLSLL